MGDPYVRGLVAELLRMRRHEPLVDADYIMQHEGLRTKVYNDSKGNATIGVGHLVKESTPFVMKKLFGRKFNANAVIEGKKSLTREQAVQLFEHDLQIRANELRAAFPRYDMYPKYLRTALMDGWFRGDLAGSPRTQELIRRGKLGSASLEYVNHAEYKSLPEDSGIKQRMNKNAIAMYQYSKDKTEGLINQYAGVEDGMARNP